MDSTETELKLAVPTEMLSRIPRVPAIAAWKSGRAHSQLLRSCYYDTPDMALQQAGIVVRLRQAGQHWIQTVKDAGARTSSLFERHEWEIEAPLAELHRPHLLALGLPTLRQPGLLDHLQPVFSTEIRRATHRLVGDGWEVEMALDHGRITVGAQDEAVSEVELELRHGPLSTLFEVAQAIAAALPCRIQNQTKSERGFRLHRGDELRPVKAQPVSLQEGMSTSAAFQCIARNCLDHLLANEPCLKGPEGAEAVHQMRVSLRRLRSALKVFKSLLKNTPLTEVREELRWLLGHLGPARDGDVFLAEIIAPVLAEHPDAPALSLLHAEWSQQRDRDFAAALAAVDDPRFTRLLLSLGQWIAEAGWAGSELAEQAVTRFARRVLKKAHRRLMVAGGQDLAHLAAAELHQVRIVGKQMRYAAEFFASLYPRTASKGYLTLLADLQDSLGALNDLAVAGPRLARAHHRGDWAWAAGLICGWHESRRPELLQAAQRTWKQLRKTPPFWR